MSTAKSRLARFVGYPLYFVSAFLAFAYLTFPYERLRDFLVQELEYPAGPGGRRIASGYRVSIVELEPYWLTGVELTGVRIEREAREAGKPKVDMTMSSVTARLQILPLFTKTAKVAFDLEGGGGTLEGSYATSFDQTSTAIDVEAHDVVMQRLGPIREEIGVPVRGIVDGHVELDLPQRADQSSGEIDLRIRNFELGDGEAKIPLPSMPSGLTIEPIRTGTLSIAMNVEAGVGTIRRFQASGPDVDLGAEGNVHFAHPLSMSRLDILLRARFKDAYRNKSPRTQALFGLLDMNQVLRSARTPDGALQVRLRGSPSTRVLPTPAGDERFGARRR